MSHAERQQGEEKKHGDVLAKALKEADTHTGGNASGSAVPAPEDGSHPRSAAAHLHEDEQLHGNSLQAGHQHSAFGTKNALRQPPQEVSRSGKQHR